jgi:CBS domain-containing protein
VKLGDLLTTDRIRVPLVGTTLAGVLEGVLAALGEISGLEEGEDAEFAERLASGSVGDWVRVNEQVLLLVARSREASDLVGILGVSPSGVELPPEDEGHEGAEPQRVHVILLLLTPRRLSTLRAQVIPALTRVIRDHDRTLRIMRAHSAQDIRGMADLMGIELDERLLVEDAMSPVSYRVYPDTPLSEVLDLMTRRGLRAVPVVGESYEVLGMITGTEALRHLLHLRRSEGEVGRPHLDETVVTARDVMSRSVMCVSEDQSLLEAANLMVNKDVAQLPVVREGELIGFLTREKVLNSLQS